MLGQTILQYQILQKLGAGGMGDIYKAQDTRLNRFVAIKAMSAGDAGDPERRRRFIQEAQAASSLNHPNIITIHDIVSYEGQDLMVMEFVGGKPLSELIGPSGLPLADILRYSVQIADALQAAHAAGIIHRDLKPANIMVTASGLVKILDFGLAKLMEDRAGGSLTDETQTIGSGPLTVEGSIIGTVNYMSPEQAQGKKVDARSDIFSFGVVLYEMVTGRKAFAADSMISTLSAILRDEARPMCENTSAPPELEQLVHRALRKDPAQRWQSMSEIHASLAAMKQRFDSGSLTIAMAAPAKKKPGIKPALAAAAALLLIVLAAGAWFVTKRNAARPAPPPPAPLAVTPAAPASPPDIKPSPLADATLTNDGVLAMVDAKVATPVIVGQIRSSKTNFDLSTAEIIRLTKAGVPPMVIEAMRNPAAAAATPAATAAATPAATAAPGTAPARTSEPTSAPAPKREIQTVQIPDGTPLSLSLAEDIPAAAEPGQPLKFQVRQDLRVGESLVIRKGAAATGEIVDKSKKKFLGKMAKPTYRLLGVTADDGSTLKVRSTADPGSAKTGRQLDPQPAPPKDLAAKAGNEFVGYIDGEQSVSAKK